MPNSAAIISVIYGYDMQCVYSEMELYEWTVAIAECATHVMLYYYYYYYSLTQ